MSWLARVVIAALALGAVVMLARDWRDRTNPVRPPPAELDADHDPVWLEADLRRHRRYAWKGEHWPDLCWGVLFALLCLALPLALADCHQHR